ncbi:MAG: hypothetical protein ACOYBE_04360 [Blautia sp.]|jgi:sensor histidine kinase regulating citrate/malate metabolism
MKRKPTLVTLGITSLFLIFSILCLVILSLLTWNSSRLDLQMSQKSMEQTAAYYTASAQASGLCQSVDAYLEKNYQDSQDLREYQESLARISELDSRIIWDDDEQVIRFTVPVSDTQDLQVTVKALYPQHDKDPYLEILSWKSTATGEWTPEKKQPVYKGENQ